VISEESDTTVLDLVDHLLTKGVMITGDVVIGVANVDLVYLRISALLCAADRMLPQAEGRAVGRTGAGVPGVRGEQSNGARAAVRVRPAP
jgi:hypothetical protein